MVSRVLLFLFLFFSITAHGNVRGSDLQNFNPNFNGLDYITVFSSQTLQPLQLNTGAYLNYTTNSLAYSLVSGTPNTQSLTEPNDRLLYSNLQLALGVLQGWEVGLAAGFVNSQDIDQSNFLFSYADTGINDVLLHTKVRLVNDPLWGFALVAGLDFDQVQNNPFAGENSGTSVNLEGVVDFKLAERWLWSMNLGYRFRQEGTPIPNTGVIPMSDQLVYSSALAYRTSAQGSTVVAEIFGSFPMEDFTLPTDRQTSNLETLVAYRWQANQQVNLQGGLGTELYHGLGSPDIRAFLGLNILFGFLGERPDLNQEPDRMFSPPPPQQQSPNRAADSDQDGVPDPIDQCPNTWAQNFVDERGCPLQGHSSPNVESDEFTIPE
jgi:hypothetical protein